MLLGLKCCDMVQSYWQKRVIMLQQKPSNTFYYHHMVKGMKVSLHFDVR